MNILLWIIQVLLALLFIFAGATKFVMPVEEMNRQAPVVLPGLFLHFIGVCEMLGAIGLILPALLRIKPGLTPLAAAGLAIITLGATVITMKGGIAMAVVPFVVCLLSIFVAYGRWRVAPIAPR
ncbi:MAG TPA: DoxX family protein [Pyrinomonadaceae bacterium]|jgi:uncharacterized membrane protein YphA (DoxX/SURF4 family)